MLRDHPIFQSPVAIDRAQLVLRPWPAEWVDPHDKNEILVLPLIRAGLKPSAPGWCTYTREMAEAPEIEVFCGGINAKTSTAAAIWRQGNLLHYGFEISPDEMNEWGKALLVDAVAYISRFTEDRPIMQTPSPFAGSTFMTRATIERVIASHDESRWDYLTPHLDGGMLTRAGIRNLSTFANWYPMVRDFLYPDQEARLKVDEDARGLGINPSRPEFFERAITALTGSDEQAEPMRRMLERYAPEGPGRSAPARAWANWWQANREYLFFGEAGGYRWYLDPLAKARRVPTANLRGLARASR